MCVCNFASWLDDWLVGWLAECELIGWLADWLVGCLGISWLLGLLDVWLIGWLENHKNGSLALALKSDLILSIS